MAQLGRALGSEMQPVFRTAQRNVRTCLRCKTLLEPSRRTKWCSLCKTRYDQQYNADPAVRQRHHERRVERRRALAKQVWEWLSQHPCVDCGQSDPRFLEPDHQGNKLMNISRMVSYGFAWTKVLAELGVCESRCLYCHRLRTAQQQGWWWASITDPSSAGERRVRDAEAPGAAPGDRTSTPT